MNRTLWALMAWTPEYGAATTVVAVLGLDSHPDGDLDLMIAWVPQQYQRCAVWRARLADTPIDKLPAELEIWQLNLANPAVPIDVPPPAPDLHTAVHAQLDDILASGLAS